MDQITLGQIAVSLAFIVGLISSVAYLKSHIEEWFSKPLKKELEPIKDQIMEIDLNGTKNFLVRCLKDIERGTQLSEVELERFWEQYSHYEEKGGNSYIKKKVEQLEKEGLFKFPSNFSSKEE